MRNYLVNHRICNKCKLCVEICPVNLIKQGENGLIKFINNRKDICLECGQCMAICKSSAIKIEKYNYEDNLKKIPKDFISHDNFIDFISSRRSVRNFKNKKVEEEKINKILEVLRYAPYGAMPNNVEITVINNRDRIQHILPMAEEFLDNIVKWIKKPIMRKIIKLKLGVETYNTIRNHIYPMAKLNNYKLKYGDRITRDAPALIIFHAKKGAEEHTNNSLIYATYTMLAIHSCGLGGSMNGIIPAAINKDPRIKEAFNIPENHEATMSLTLGYPKYKYAKAIIREQKKVNWVA
ncbi:MAG: hypothetical protein DRI86_03140 [Bacteroidetes bacterium]|nr:MAG: hypothetical protein DRI86_03140 [Bacteroidota bacterium]